MVVVAQLVEHWIVIPRVASSNLVNHPIERLKMNIKDMVKDNQTVSFQFYRDGNLWYKTENDFSFPVPINDIGNATFMAQDRAMLFMRYIRKHLQTIEQKDNSF